MKPSADKIFATGLLASLLMLSTSIGFAQEGTHTGFYLSMQLGPAFGYINGSNNVVDSFTITGKSLAFDIKVGTALQENLILFGALGYKWIDAPTIDGVFLDEELDKYTFNSDHSMTEFYIGGGSTYYLKHNFFLSGTLGGGTFQFSEASSLLYKTNWGLSYQLMAGKEWWISSRWSMGLALEYGSTRTQYTKESYEETWQSHNRFSIRLTATLNGSKKRST